MDHILDFGLSYAAVVKALPILREVRKMPRQYICNVVYTLVGNPFREWMMARVKEHDHQIAIKQNLLVQFDPKIAAAFAKSSMISRKFIFCILIYLIRFRLLMPLCFE